MTGILVVAATEHELAWADGAARTLACGVGPVEAALATLAALDAERPAGILHLGIAGARPPLRVLDVAVGTRSVYVDLVDAASLVERRTAVEPDAALLAAVRAALPEAHAVAIATTARVGASRREPVEGMEGFGVLRAAALRGVPAVELRVVSNAIDEPDRARWDFAGALASLAGVGARALEALTASGTV